ncbi:hypothetical protein QBC42DRAFT_317617 [Cladorrhinum samala]|uniref:Copper acquisition factor BIM1-like domain-containing protein n=1 Tax=Cladorrhinum samala TaxID=585594 RepID=A0AAV9HZ22_9PEZI|nr:hypothetical protein QBC42DRAFT_317617 [Cladorrhinum samala]
MAPMMQPAALLLFSFAAGVLSQSEKQGPAAFWWPPDRGWHEDDDNSAPCGSRESVGNRTAFPLTGGRIAFTAQDDSYNAVISISFSQDPKTQAEFSSALNIAPIPELDPGHTCFTIPDPPFTITPGTNATLQLKYTADFDRPENQTFYACADITYVLQDTWQALHGDKIPCFNASDSENNVPAPTATGIPTNLPGHGDDGPPLSTGTGIPVQVGGTAGGNKLSKGAIAGIVLGSCLGLSLVVGLGLLFYRERQRKNRLIAQRDSGRGVPWVQDDAVASGKNSTSQASGESIRMGNMQR